MTDQKRISVLEDSMEVQKMLVDALVAAEYDVRSYGRAQDFERELADWCPDLCIVDLGLPDKDGLGLLGQISKSCNSDISNGLAR